MTISEILKGLLIKTKKIDNSKLPSQGLFYKTDFVIKIRKVDLEDIIEYEFNYNKENLFSIIESVKKIVRKNIILTNDYKFEDIKSVDIVFLFLELVKLTTGKEISISYFNDEIGKLEDIEFSSDNFNYFDFSKYEWDSENSEILINGYRFSMPSIGIENSLTQFFINKSDEPDSIKWNNYNYDFLFFVGNKRSLSFSEIENLVYIFNFDIDSSEKDKIRGMVKSFNKMVGYSLRKGEKIIDVKSKLDLESIWK